MVAKTGDVIILIFSKLMNVTWKILNQPAESCPYFGYVAIK